MTADPWRRITAVLALALISCRPTSPDRTSVLAAARRLHGDLILLSMSGPFTDIELIHASLARDAAALEHSSVFFTSPAEATAGSHVATAVLKLEPLDDLNARALGLGPDQVADLRTQEGDPRIAMGDLLARELAVAPGDRLTLSVPPQRGSKKSVRCQVASVVHWGLEPSDKLLVLADLSHSATFEAEPTGLELRLFEPGNRSSFARHLQQRLGPRFRAVPLEELMAPLLKNADSR